MARRTRTISSAPWIFLGGLVMALVIGWLDRATGPYLSFALVYLGPIAFVTWRLGRMQGLIITSICTVAGLIGDQSSVPQALWFVPFWNAAARLGVYVLVVLVLDWLRKAHETERQLARTDPLTGTANARHFTDEVRRLMAEARRYGHALTLAYVDLDNFKAINDMFGHSTGDALLQRVGMILAREARTADLVARIGGDEFAMLLPHTDAHGAALALSRHRDLLLEEMAANGWAVTFSVGIESLNEHIETVDGFVAAADAMMYNAKKSGKDLIAWRDGTSVRLDQTCAPTLEEAGRRAG